MGPATYLYCVASGIGQPSSSPILPADQQIQAAIEDIFAVSELNNWLRE